MKVLRQNIKGARKLVLETALASVFMLIIYMVAYRISGESEIALALSALAALVALAFAPALAATFAAPALAAALAFAASAAAFVAVFAALVVALVAASEDKIRYWKIFIVYTLEGLALFSATKFAVPYLAIGVLTALCLAAAFLFAEQKLRPRLSADKPQK